MISGSEKKLVRLSYFLLTLCTNSAELDNKTSLALTVCRQPERFTWRTKQTSPKRDYFFFHPQDEKDLSHCWNKMLKMLFLEQSMVIFVNLTSVCTRLQNFCTELTISGLNKTLKKKSFSFTFFCKNAVALLAYKDWANKPTVSFHRLLGKSFDRV